MAKTPKPWYRKAKDAWFICLAGKQVLLAKGKANKAAAKQRYHELMLVQSAATAPEAADATAASICEAYLEWCQRHRRDGTYKWYRFFLQDFAEAAGRTKVADLKPFHITRWMDSHAWNDSTTHGAITCVLRSLNWAVDEGLIPAHGLRKITRPPVKRRKRVLTDEELDQLISAADRHFADFLRALRGTGARPGELRNLMWPMVDLARGICILNEHKTSTQRDEPRVLVLTAEMQALFGERKLKFPLRQHVFVNRLGRPWTTNAVRLRMRRLRAKLRLDGDVVAYTLRHTFGTKAVLNGVDLKTLSELMGHASLATTEIYLHLAGQKEHLQKAIEQATASKPAPAQSVRA